MAFKCNYLWIFTSNHFCGKIHLTDMNFAANGKTKIRDLGFLRPTPTVKEYVISSSPIHLIYIHLE